MGRVILTIALTTTAALALTGCGLADSHAIWPDFMKTKTVEPALEAPPDARLLVGQHLDAVFTAGSNPQEVQVSPARHDLRGPGWTACVRADLTSATGKPLGQQTYRVNINDGVILDRQRVDSEDTCFSETFAPI
ncbi:MAG TPA: hypothetical protein VGL45_08725 [Bradyrhizobium sp.]|jgi:hypothetical protein